jgi:hypothetical protein
VREVENEREEPGRARDAMAMPVPGIARAGCADLLALQRLAGNRAVARLVGSDGRAGPRQRGQVLARKSHSTVKAPPRKPVTFGYRVFFAAGTHLDPDEVRDAFVRQYYGAHSEAEVATKRNLWTLPDRGTTVEEERHGSVELSVTTVFQTDLGDLDAAEKQGINDETDRRYWAAHNLPERTKIDPHDKAAADEWKGLRNAVLTEDRQMREIQSLPDDIKAILFAGGQGAQVLSREDFTRVLAVAKKLAALTPEERADYLARVSGSTLSFADMEASIERYVELRRRRDELDASFDAAAEPLLGGEDLYSLYRDWKSLHGMEDLDDLDDLPHHSHPMRDLAAAKERELLAALKAKGFDSIATYEAVLERYRVVFRTEAVTLALDLLARYEHMLFEERRKLEAGGADAIARGIAASGAAGLYATAREEESTASNLRFARDPEAKGANADLDRMIRQHEAAGASARSGAEEAVIKGSGNDSLVGERKIDREKLASLDADGVRAYLLDVIADRQKDIAKAKADFAEDPDRVFKLDPLISAELQLQQIEPKSIYERVISDYISDEHAKHLVSEIVTGILVIALAVLVPGGGWIAAAALIGSAALSSYQAYEAVQNYEKEERDYKLHFLNDEPSLFWVVVAIIGAAADIGAATGAVVKAGALMKESAAALEGLEQPLKDFSHGGELKTLLERIDAAEGLRPEVKAALDRAARAADQSRAAWKDALGAASTVNTGVNVAGVEAFRALFYSLKRGVNTITKLRKEAEFLEILREITGLSGAQREELETAFKEVKTLVKTGTARRMDDATMLEYVDRWSANRTNPTARAKLLDEMRAWKPLTQEQRSARAALKRQTEAVASLYTAKAELLEELDELRTLQRDPATRAPDNATRIHAIEAELTELDPTALPAKTGAARPVGGKIREAEHTLAQVEEAARKAELTLYDRVRRATPSAATREKTANLWKAEKARRGIVGDAVDQVGALKTKAGRLEADHIVCVREIVELDGFKDLPWKQQKAIVDMRENMIAMDEFANASKNDVAWQFWKGAGRFYDDAVIAVMRTREAAVRDLIKKAIANAKAMPAP